MAMHDDRIDPPNTMTVDHARRPLLYLADGTAMVRQVGFRCVQTTGTNPPLSDNTQRRPPKKGKK